MARTFKENGMTIEPRGCTKMVVLWVSEFGRTRKTIVVPECQQIDSAHLALSEQPLH